jgi:hypothetical protein
MSGWNMFQHMVILSALIMEGIYGIRCVVADANADPVTYQIPHAFEVVVDLRRRFSELFGRLCGHFGCYVSHPEDYIEGILQDNDVPIIITPNYGSVLHVHRNRFFSYIRVGRNPLEPKQRRESIDMLLNLNNCFSCYLPADFGTDPHPIPAIDAFPLIDSGSEVDVYFYTKMM